jgi:hypothetical protein
MKDYSKRIDGLWRFNRVRQLLREAEDAYRRGDFQSGYILEHAAWEAEFEMDMRALERKQRNDA